MRKKGEKKERGRWIRTHSSGVDNDALELRLGSYGFYIVGVGF